MAEESYKQFNCYEVLSTSAGATPEEIKSAFRKASLKAHPDVGGSNEAQAKVNLAYEVLSDPVQRNAHDMYWSLRSGPRATPQGSQRTASSPGSQQRSAPAGGLAGLRERLERAIDAERVRIWNTKSSRQSAKIEELQRQFATAQSTFYWAAGIGAVSLLLVGPLPIFWIGVIGGGLVALSGFGGVDIAGRKFSVFGMDRQALAAHAEDLVRQQCESEVGTLAQRNAEFEQIMDILTRPSSQSDDEIHVARRISAALFVMGYAPVYYDSENRMMVFADGEEKLVARFRHRDGASVNVSYVERLHMFARAHGARHALLFCSPGLSENAAAYAKRHGITPYTLERMNAWIGDVSRSNYTGPNGDILEQIPKFIRFLGGVAPKDSRPYYGSRRRYRRYR